MARDLKKEVKTPWTQLFYTKSTQHARFFYVLIKQQFQRVSGITEKSYRTIKLNSTTATYQGNSTLFAIDYDRPINGLFIVIENAKYAKKGVTSYNLRIPVNIYVKYGENNSKSMLLDRNAYLNHEYVSGSGLGNNNYNFIVMDTLTGGVTRFGDAIFKFDNRAAAYHFSLMNGGGYSRIDRGSQFFMPALYSDVDRYPTNGYYGLFVPIENYFIGRFEVVLALPLINEGYTVLFTAKVCVSYLT